VSTPSNDIPPLQISTIFPHLPTATATAATTTTTSDFVLYFVRRKLDEVSL